MKKIKNILFLISLLFINFIYSQNSCNEIISINEGEEIIFLNENLILIPIYSSINYPVSSYQFNLIFNNEFISYQSNQIGLINNSIFNNSNNIPISFTNTNNGGNISSNLSQIDDEYSILTIAYATNQIETPNDILLYIPFFLNNDNGCIELSFSDGFFNNDYIFPNQNFEFLLNNIDISECVNDGNICFSCIDNNDNSICDSDEIIGCTDSLACNYNSEANVDDGSCLIEGSSCYTVIDENCCCCGVCDCVCEQNIVYPLTCEYEITGTGNAPWNIVIQGQIQDCECVTEEVIGCTDPLACNFNIYATQDDNSCFFSSECGDCEIIGSTQSIELSSGWSLFSTYICPFQPNFESIMSDLINENNLVILKDGSGSVFWPEFEINNIGNIQNGMGYLIKIQNQTTLNVYGSLLDYSFPIEINSGWSYLGYLNQDCYSAVEMMNPIINDFVILKDSDGYVYWPMFEINAIGNLCPGEGYQINVENNVTLSYQIGTEGSRYGNNNIERTIYFKEPTNTGSNMIIAFPQYAWESTLSIGDEIAAYDEEGKLIGSTVYEGSNIALTVWGDDITTDQKDGLLEGERIIFRLWNSTTSTEQVLDIKWEEGSGIYFNNGISIAGQIILGNELNSQRQLIKITDILGKEVNGNEKDVMLLYIYDDGSIERVFVKE